MKTIITSTKTALLGTLVFVAQAICAQDKPANNSNNPDQQKYRLYLVKDENGNKEVIDKTFTSKEDMDVYIKENKIDVPEVSGKSTPPLPSGFKSHHGDKKEDKAHDQKEKKIIIIEKEEGGTNGNGSLEITYKDLSAEERAALIQELLNQNGNRVQLIQVPKSSIPVKGES